MDISDHTVERKLFPSDCLVTETNKNKQMLKFRREFKYQAIRNLTFLFMFFTSTHLNGISIVFFLQPRFHVKLLNANQHVMANFMEVNIFAAAEPNLKI